MRNGGDCFGWRQYRADIFVSDRGIAGQFLSWRWTFVTANAPSLALALAMQLGEGAAAQRGGSAEG